MERRIKVGDELWLLVKSTVGDGDIPLKAELVFQGASTGICIGGEDCFDVDGVHLGMKYRATRDSEVLAAEIGTDARRTWETVKDAAVAVFRRGASKVK